MQSILDSAELAAFFPVKEKIGILLQGTRISSGATGHRPQVFPLPAISTEQSRIKELMYRYATDSSPLAIERLLLSCFKERQRDLAYEALLETSVQPIFYTHRAVFRSVSAVLRCSEYLENKDFQKVEAPFLSWVTGKSRNAPVPDALDAIVWMQGHDKDLGKIRFGTECIELSTLQETLAGENVANLFDKILSLLKKGFAYESLLNAFSVLSARRFEALGLNNGGLWNTATEGIRLCNSIRRVVEHTTSKFKINSLFMLSYYFFESRWLKANSAAGSENTVKEASWEEVQNSFLSFQLSPARNQVNSLLQGLDRQNLENFVAPLCTNLIKNDLTAIQINTLIAVFHEQKHQKEWEPYFNGLITYFMDRKLSQEVEAATQFGRSFFHESVEEE